MIEVNQISFTGEVIAGRKTDKGLYLSLFQKVAGRINTTFTVFAPSISLPDLDFHEKDVVFINNGLVYGSENGFTIRVISPDQIQLLKRNYDEGIADAEEEF